MGLGVALPGCDGGLGLGVGLAGCWFLCAGKYIAPLTNHELVGTVSSKCEVNHLRSDLKNYMIGQLIGRCCSMLISARCYTLVIRI